MSEGLFDRAREAISVEDLAGRATVLKRRGRELRGPCPLCQPGRKDGTAFSVTGEKWRCYACGLRGDVVDLHAELTGLGGVEAAKELAGDRPALTAAKPKASPIAVPDDDARAARIARLAAELWADAGALAGTIGETYLKAARRIEPEIIDAVDHAGGLRFHPDAPHHWDERARVWARAPAIVAKVQTPGGWTGGVHATYLAPDGAAKASLDPARLMWGPQGDASEVGRRRGGAWLIEAGQLRVAAALSLGALQGGAQRDADGCIDVWRPMADPAVPAFVWPPCNTAADVVVGEGVETSLSLASHLRRRGHEHGSGRVWLAIDRDMAPVRARIRSGRGRVTPAWLDAEARARLCAILARQAWLAAGWRRVTPMWPDTLRDWNDMLETGAA